MNLETVALPNDKSNQSSSLPQLFRLSLLEEQHVAPFVFFGIKFCSEVLVYCLKHQNPTCRRGCKKLGRMHILQSLKLALFGKILMWNVWF